MIEWTTGRYYLPIYHVDRALNLSDLLTKKHDLTVEDLSTGSNWQTGLPQIKLGTEDMPLSLYQSLTIIKEISPVPEPLILETEITGLSTGVNVSVFLGTMPPPPPNAGQDGS